MHFNLSFLKNNRLYKLCNLLFFLLFLYPGCNPAEKDIRILWEDEKAIGIEIPKHLLPDLPQDSILSHLSIRLLKSADTVNILGSFNLNTNIQFKPVIPFTRGLHYEVFFLSKKIGEFGISNATEEDKPQVLTFYPSTDTLPSNLLKIYIQFSHPMREAQAEKYISLIKNGKDTLRDVFLYLQPELWNDDRTVLTIWLDPGRIKRDLQPNLKLGSPLKEKADYQFNISKQWTDKQGRLLKKEFTHEFIVGNRDSLSPITENWQLQIPAAQSTTALQINVQEPLDHYLLMDCLHIKNSKGQSVKGKFTTAKNDAQVIFIPDDPWQKMDYWVEVESRLEDLAGNNLNRLFDRDITQAKKSITKNMYRISFLIK